MAGNYRIYRFPGKIRKLLNCRRITVNSVLSGKGVLHLAARAGNVETVRLLVDSGADTDKLDFADLTPLHVALFHRKLEAASYLVQKASVNLSKPCYRDILFVAGTTQDLPTVELILSHGADQHYISPFGNCALHYLAWVEEPQIINSIIETTDDLNRQNGKGYSILHTAVTEGNLFLIQELIRRGAKVDLLTRNKDDTPLHLAMFDYRRWGSEVRRCHEITEALLEAGANPNARNQSLMTPLMYAMEWSDIKLIKVLIDGGADPTVTSCTGQSVLHYAVENHPEKVMRVLLSKPNVNTNGKCSAGFTVLHFAVARHKYGTVELLLQNGADVDLADSTGKSPLLMAILGADLCCVELLMNYGARVKRRDMRTVADMRDSHYKQRVSRILIEGMAKLGYNDPVLEDSHREAMVDHLRSEMFYDHCLDELREMKATVIENGCCVTMFDLLTKIKQIDGYSRNALLENKMNVRNEEFKEKFPIFFDRIWNRFRVAAEKQKRIKKASLLLNGIFGLNNSMTVITSKIVGYLNEYELGFLLPND